MTSAGLQAYHDALIQMGEQMSAGQPTLEDLRAGIEGLGAFASEPEGVKFEAVDAGGVQAEWATPEDAGSGTAVIYLHGGGFALGSINSHRKVAGHLARAAGARTLVLGYRLAPENPHPAAIEDIVAAYRWLHDTGAASTIAFAGDSAGGNLAIAALLAVRDQGLPAPAGAVAFSPLLDLEASGESMTTLAEKDLSNGPDAVRGMAAMYLGDLDPRTPLAAPIHADLDGIPPVYIQVGDQEVLLDDATTFADRAKSAGASVTVEILPGMQHDFQITAGNAPEADKAIADAGAFLRAQLGS